MGFFLSFLFFFFSKLGKGVMPVAEALEALNCSVLNCRDATTASECF